MTERPCSQSDGQLVLPPIELKERLHHFPTQRTNVASADLRTRHRMLGNSWHVGIAQFILFFILSSCRATAVILADNTIPNRPKQSSIQLMFSLAQGEEHAMGPIPRRFDPMRKAPAVDQWEHWRLAKSLCHPLLQQPVLEPGAAQVLHKLNNMGDIDRLRKEVIEDLTQMIDDWGDYTQRWMDSRPTHIKAVYQSGDGPHTQIPVFLELLSQCGYPAMEDITQDLSFGFDYVGEQHPGPGWLPRLDEAYAHPIKIGAFATLNETSNVSIKSSGRALSTLTGEQCFRNWKMKNYVVVFKVLSHFLWSHDLDSRQFPVKDQAFSYTILFTDDGPTLWRHGSLAFGATSSVWAFRSCCRLSYVSLSKTHTDQSVPLRRRLCSC